MRVAQVSPTKDEPCGLAVWADDLGAHLSGHGFSVRTTSLDAVELCDSDLVLVQHHDELGIEERLAELCARSPCPVVLFAHSTGAGPLLGLVDGVLAMSAGLVPDTELPTFVFPHPAFVPDGLEDRTALRAEFGLRTGGKVLGSCGFLKFDRQLVELLSLLLPRLAETNSAVHLLTSPWRLDSPGVLDGIAELAERHPERVWHEHRMLDGIEMNRRLQACDVVWCWTRAPSTAYASGVISRLYGSGSRVVAVDKEQHEHVLGLPNVVRAPTSLPEFVDVLLAEIAASSVPRHDPDPVSWRHVVPRVAAFLREVCRNGRGAVPGQVRST